MFKILRLLGIVNHSMKSIRADREQQLVLTELDLDMMEKQLEEVRSVINALKQRRVRLTRDLNKMRGEGEPHA